MARRVPLSFVTLVAIALVLAFVVPRFLPWTVLNCSTSSIDITCGRVRHEAWLPGVKWSDRMEDTDISRMYFELVGEPPAPDWHPAITLSPGVRHSPHYTYHSALYDMGRLAESFRGTVFSEEARRRAIVDFFGLLRKEGNDYRAGRYVDAIQDRVVKRMLAREARLLSPDELPDPGQLENP